jgi:hypothetical protein
VTGAELFAALWPVVEVLDRLSVRYYVGGSAASSIHGVPRASVDVDVTAELSLPHVPAFVEALSTDYYLDEGRVRDAVTRRRSFNAIHLATMFKVDVFVSRDRPFDREVFARAATRTGGPQASGAYRFASAEDVVLLKLEWFRAGGEVSDRQWADVLGVVRAVADKLDRPYLERWAPTIGVADLLERAEAEAAS